MHTYTIGNSNSGTRAEKIPELVNITTWTNCCFLINILKQVESEFYFFSLFPSNKLAVGNIRNLGYLYTGLPYYNFVYVAFVA